MKTNNNDHQVKEDYWVRKKRYCRSFFSRAALNGKKAVIARYGTGRGMKLMDDVRRQYESFLPEVPYIGEVDLLKRQMLLTVVFASFYKVLHDEEPIGDIWMLCSDFNRATVMSMPGFIRAGMKKATFSAKTKDLYRRKSREHREQNLADQWDYVEGDGKIFEYGMNITKCAKLLLLQKLGMSEFAPYVCLIDQTFAECLGYSLVRTQVLAEGADHCDFRLSQDGPIDVRTTVRF